MAPHSKDLYEPPIIKNEQDLKEEIKYLKSKSSILPNYIIIRKSHISSRKDQDVGYGQTYLLVYNTKTKSYTMFHSYDKTPFEFSIDMLRGGIRGNSRNI
jgi:hypothetical protein